MVVSLGLVLDIVGVALIFRYGVAPAVSASGAQLLAWGHDESEKVRYRRYKRVSRIGLGCLMGGFFLQLIGNYISTG